MNNRFSPKASHKLLPGLTQYHYPMEIDERAFTRFQQLMDDELEKLLEHWGTPERVLDTVQK